MKKTKDAKSQLRGVQCPAKREKGMMGVCFIGKHIACDRFEFLL